MTTKFFLRITADYFQAKLSVIGQHIIILMIGHTLNHDSGG
jgi:hypothetical protein